MRFVQKILLKYIRTKFKILSSISKRKAASKAFLLFCMPQSRVKSLLPMIFQKAEKLRFQLEHDTVHGYRWNHPSSKKVLILHGFESSVINFEKYVQPLIDKGYEVLAFDAPAHGRSTGRSITIITYKKMILHIQREFGPVDSFITHSFGGLSLSMALEEIDHTATTRVVFIAPAAETTTAIDNFFNLLRLDKGVRKEFDQLITELGNHPPAWYSLPRAVAHIRAQVLYLQDKDDQQTPLSDVLPLKHKNYPHIQFVISEGLGHSRIYRDSQTLNRVIEFL